MVRANSIEKEFIETVETAAAMSNAPMAFIYIAIEGYKHLEASIGLEHDTEDFGQLLASIASRQTSVFEIGDIASDPRFNNTTFKQCGRTIRTVTGSGLLSSNGQFFGVLGIGDTAPRQLNSTQSAVLSHLARLLEGLINNYYFSMQQDKIPTRQQADTKLLSLAKGNHFQTLCELSPLGIFATDADGLCTYTNKEWQKIFGLTLEGSLGNGWQQGLHPDDKQFIFNTWSANANSKLEFNFEFRTRHRNGATRHVRSRAKPSTNSKNEIVGFIGAVEDITQQRETDHENLSLLATLRSHFIVSITSLNGDIIEANDAFCDISQFNREELIGANHRIVNSGTHSRSFFTNLWETLKAGKTWRGEICNLSKHGNPYWVESIMTPLVNVNGDIDRYISIRIDVTKRKSQEEELRKHRTLLDSIGTVAGVGGWEMDLRDDAIFWSDETCRIHGVELGYVPSTEEVINFYAPGARKIIRDALSRAMETGQGWDLELPLITRHGTQIWVRTVASAEFANGSPIRLLGAFQDVAEKVLQNKAIEETHSRMALATDSGKIGVWEYDIESGVVIWDDWMHRLYGITPDRANRSGMRVETYSFWLERVHPDDRKSAEKSVDEAINGIRNFDEEFRIIWNDGSIHHLRAAARLTRNEDGTPKKMIGVNWDVSDLKNAVKKLAEQSELLHVTLKSIGDAVITTDASGKTRWLNPIAERMTGWTSSQAFGLPLSDVFSIINEKTRLVTGSPVELCLKQGKRVGLADNTTLLSRNGDEYGIEDSAAPIRNDSGDILGAVLVFRDVTEQRRLSDELNHQATHDALTGLYNRAEFESRLQRLLNPQYDRAEHHALLFIDLDQFKIVNDTSGHSVGDLILKQVSGMLTEITRTRDTLARLGGDEFGVILEHCSGEKALRVAEEICSKMEAFRFTHKSHRFRIGASVGLVEISESWPTTAALMQAADTACYAAKDAGRNRVRMWSESDLAIRARHGQMQWTTRIESALDDDRFELFAQRIGSLNGKQSGIHAEVLVRMKDEDGRLILPGAFLPAAERFHLASRIDRRVLRTAIDWLVGLSASGSANIELLSINLSGQSIGDLAFHRYALDIFESVGVNVCSCICIEITETAAITNFIDASQFIKQLSQLGVLVALDDFGAGASSFDYLKNLAVDILKIDGQFIQDLVDDQLDEAAVRCFVEVAKVIDLKTVAEFVDSDELLERVKQLGIDYAQGFLLHEPEPIDLILTEDSI